MANFDAVVSKAITDSEFCRNLVADPQGTLKSNGIDATPEMLSALRAIDANAVQKLAVAFGKDQAVVLIGGKDKLDLETIDLP